MQTPYVSVVLPTYNGALFLEETLQSFGAQLRPIQQLVCSDDQSDDNTNQIIKAFSKTADFEVIHLSHERNGVTENYLNALKYVTGDLVLVADQDDVWLNNKTQLMVTALQDPRISLISHDSLLVDDELNSLDQTVRGNLNHSKQLSNRINSANDRGNLESYLRGNIPLLAHTLGFKASLIPLLLNKPINIEEWWFEEWLSCIALTQGRLELIAKHLVLYRQHSTQSSGGLSNNSSKIGVSPGLNKYKSRIEKINYCANLIAKNNGDPERQQTLFNYANFLGSRQSLISSGLLTAIHGVARQLINGHYARYARGGASAALDIITNLKTKKS